MTKYIIRRLLWAIPVLFFVALITFALMHAAPGGPWDRDLNRRQVDPATQKMLNEKFGLDKPLWINTQGGNPLDSQFLSYVGGALRGDLGPSYRQRGMMVQDILFKPPEDQPFWNSKMGYSAYTFPQPVAESYHTFSVEWSPDQIRWFVDGINYHNATPADVAPREWVFNHPFYLIMNLSLIHI